MATKRKKDETSRKTARAAEPEVVEEASAPAPEDGAEDVVVAEAGAEPREDQAEDQASTDEAAPADGARDPEIVAFAQRFLVEKGFLSGGKEEAPEVTVEPIVHELPGPPRSSNPQSLLKSGREWLAALFAAMNLEVEAKSRYDKETKTLHFDLAGEGKSNLLGHTGMSPRVLESIEKVLFQFLDLEGGKYQLHIDVDAFRSRRTEHLREVADRLAEVSRAVGKSIVVAGMNDFERRVVHRKLADVDDVDTDSFGHGSFRKIRIQHN